MEVLHLHEQTGQLHLSIITITMNMNVAHILVVFVQFLLCLHQVPKQVTGKI